MKRLILILFIASCYALNLHAQKTISYKVSDGKAYYKVEEVGKEPMYYRKKLVDGSVSMDFEKVSNGIFGEQYEEVKAEVKHVDGADQARAVEEMVRQDKEAREIAEAAAKEKKARAEKVKTETVEKKVVSVKDLKVENEELDESDVAVSGLTTEQKELLLLLKESKKQTQHLATMKWITICSIGVSVLAVIAALAGVTK